MPTTLIGTVRYLFLGTERAGCRATMRTWTGSSWNGTTNAPSSRRRCGRRRDGAGCVVLISGEAGAGKSSVIRAALPTKIRTLVGHCDDATTRRTLGPFRDLAGSVGAELAGHWTPVTT